MRKIAKWKNDHLYMTGNKTIYNKYIWVSIIDYNIYKPGTFGWVIVKKYNKKEV